MEKNKDYSTISKDDKYTSTVLKDFLKTYYSPDSHLAPQISELEQIEDQLPEDGNVDISDTKNQDVEEMQFLNAFHRPDVMFILLDLEQQIRFNKRLSFSMLKNIDENDIKKLVENFILTDKSNSPKKRFNSKQLNDMISKMEKLTIEQSIEYYVKQTNKKIAESYRTSLEVHSWWMKGMYKKILYKYLKVYGIHYLGLPEGEKNYIESLFNTLTDSIKQTYKNTITKDQLWEKVIRYIEIFNACCDQDIIQRKDRRINSQLLKDYDKLENIYIDFYDLLPTYQMLDTDEAYLMAPILKYISNLQSFIDRDELGKKGRSKRGFYYAFIYRLYMIIEDVEEISNKYKWIADVGADLIEIRKIIIDKYCESIHHRLRDSRDLLRILDEDSVSKIINEEELRSKKVLIEEGIIDDIPGPRESDKKWKEALENAIKMTDRYNKSDIEYFKKELEEVNQRLKGKYPKTLY